MSHKAPRLLDTPREVIRCLVTYNDWWQPGSASFVQLGRKRKDRSDGLHPRLVETFEERVELCRRMEALNERDRNILFLWYVEQLHVEDIARETGISRRQCFRRRAHAVQAIADHGKPPTTQHHPAPTVLGVRVFPV